MTRRRISLSSASTATATLIRKTSERGEKDDDEEGQGAQGKSVTPAGRKERVKIAKRLTKRYERLREKYPEVHGKVVDFVTRPRTERWFTDKTELTLRYRIRMLASGAVLFDVKTGDLDLIRRYIRPISI